MNNDRLLKSENKRDLADKSCIEILSLARETGEENKEYVRNAINRLMTFSYDPHLVKYTLRRLKKKKALKFINRNDFNLPDPRFSTGNILIGNAIGKNSSIYLNFRHLNENIGIWGRAGSGKTNLCQLITIQLVRAGIPVRAFDYKDEYRDLAPHISDMIVLNPKNDKFNPLQSIGDPRAWLQFLADTLQQDFNLRSESKFLWLYYADELYKRYDVYNKGRIYPSIWDMKEFLVEEANKKSTPASSRRKIYTCLEVIHSLLTSIGDMLDCSAGYNEETLSGISFVSYEMSNLSSNIQSWLTKLRLKHLYNLCLSRKGWHRLKVVAVFEEAKQLFGEGLHKSSSNIDYIKQLQTQARASGYGSIITDQNRSELADFVVNNLSCQIMLNLVSPKEIRSAGYSMGCNEEQVKEIRNLKIPYGIVSFSGYQPFKIRIPKLL